MGGGRMHRSGGPRAWVRGQHARVGGHVTPTSPDLSCETPPAGSRPFASPLPPRECAWCLLGVLADFPQGYTSPCPRCAYGGPTHIHTISLSFCGRGQSCSLWEKRSLSDHQRRPQPPPPGHAGFCWVLTAPAGEAPRPERPSQVADQHGEVEATGSEHAVSA